MISGNVGINLLIHEGMLWNQNVLLNIFGNSDMLGIKFYYKLLE
jgi:hypothetical protein